MAREDNFNRKNQKSLSQKPASDTAGVEIARTTLMLPTTIDQNLEVYALSKGVNKGEVIQLALRDFLQRNGLQPDKTPKIQVVY